MSDADEMLGSKLSWWAGQLTDGLDERAAADLSGFLLDVKHHLLTVTRDLAAHDAAIRAEAFYDAAVEVSECGYPYTRKHYVDHLFDRARAIREGEQ